MKCKRRLFDIFIQRNEKGERIREEIKATDPFHPDNMDEMKFVLPNSKGEEIDFDFSDQTEFEMPAIAEVTFAGKADGDEPVIIDGNKLEKFPAKVEVKSLKGSYISGSIGGGDGAETHTLIIRRK